MIPRYKRFLPACGLVLAVSLPLGAAWADDWPQWRGSARDGLSKETGLLKQWPAEGPALAWKAAGLGEGYSSVAVSKGRVYGMGLKDGKDIVWALDEKTGKEAWATPVSDQAHLSGRQGGDGPRCTPTVDGSRVYVLTAGGVATCLDAKDGKLVWTRDIVKDFEAEVPQWGYSESPLVVGDTVVVTPGGSKTTVAALKKSDGTTAWATKTEQGDRAHYSSAILADQGGKKQIIQFLSGGVVGLDTTGKVLWRYDKPANRVANCSTPIYRDGIVVAASGYGTGGGAARLASSGGGMAAEELWFTKSMKNHHGGIVLVGNYVYGFDERDLTCLDFKTGKVMWTDRSVGKGSLTYADGNLIARGERGAEIALVEANPEKYVEKGRFKQPETHGSWQWAYPVVSNGRLYLFDNGTLYCYDVKAK